MWREGLFVFLIVGMLFILYISSAFYVGYILAEKGKLDWI